MGAEGLQALSRGAQQLSAMWCGNREEMELLLSRTLAARERGKGSQAGRSKRASSK